jgi:hypothetical protein
MQSFDFQVVVDCPLEIVFDVYADIERWRHRNLFGDIKWVQGNPWEEGSRLRIETLAPIRTTVDQVVQHFSPKESVSYLSHVLGITIETRIHFTDIPPQQTAIRVGMQLVGTLSRSLGFAIEPAIARSTRGFFEELSKECEAVFRTGEGLKNAAPNPEESV